MKTERAVIIINALCKDNKQDDAVSFLQWYISHLGKVEHPTSNEVKLQKKAEKLEREKAKNIITLENGIEIDPDDGWVVWDGVGFPFNENPRVEVILRSGETHTGISGLFRWEHYQYPTDIIAYRVIKE